MAALVAMLVTVAAVGCGLEFGFAPTDFLEIPLLLMPAFLAFWGAKLFFRLDAGFLPRVRRSLFWFYASVAAYRAAWLVTFNRDGMTKTILSPQEQLIVMVLLLIPLLSVVFMTPDSLPTSVARDGEAEQSAVRRRKLQPRSH
jgi:hypothetical protein